MNIYIQDKLDEFKKDFNLYLDNFDEMQGMGIYRIDEDSIDEIIKKHFTDYHNHIVEKIESEFDENTWTEQDGIRYDTMLANRKLQKILSLLQDTNK